ncbi:MAG: hypothetical protein NVSMB9_02400 [Isosphaeraceae bacterium]
MKWLLKYLWNRMHPIRAQIEAKIDLLAFEATNRALQGYEKPCPMAEEITLVLDGVMAEQFRLQSQIDDLERLVREALAAGESSTSLRA